MDGRTEISCIKFSAEAELSFGAALQEIANQCPSNSEDSKDKQSTHPSIHSKRFTTITDLTKDHLEVNEIDAQLLNNITEIFIPPSTNNSSLANISNAENMDSNPSSAASSVSSAVNKSSNSNSNSKKKNTYKFSDRDKVYESIRCICPECFSECPDFFCWKTHMANVHNLKQIPIQTAKGAHDYFCDKCHGLIRVDCGLKMLYHQVSHAPMPSCFECRLCNWRHTAYTRLFKHVRSHHSNL